MYVPDSSALIEGFRNGPRADKIADIVEGFSLAVTSISVHELLVGVRSEKEFAVLHNFLSHMVVLPHTADAARAGARIEHRLLKEGKLINALDVLIAAVCMAEHAHLITLDNDFSRVKGLSVTVIT